MDIVHLPLSEFNLNIKDDNFRITVPLKTVTRHKPHERYSAIL